MADINADPRVMHWIDDGSVRDLDHTAEAIEQWEEEWDEEGFGLFAVELLASGELAGFVGLSVPESCRRYCPPSPSAGGSAHPFWGQGYASEAAQATLRVALQDRGLDRVISITRPGSDPSENVIRGFRRWSARRRTRCTAIPCSFTSSISPSSRPEPVESSVPAVHALVRSGAADDATSTWVSRMLRTASRIAPYRIRAAPTSRGSAAGRCVPAPRTR